jgi:hypothetical protein
VKESSNVPSASIHGFLQEYSFNYSPVLLVFYTHARLSSVSTVTKIRDGWLWFNSRQKQGRDIFLFATVSRPALGPIQLPIQWTLGVMRPRHEADHSPLSSAAVKNVWSYISLQQYVFKLWCLIKHGMPSWCGTRLITGELYLWR